MDLPLLAQPSKLRPLRRSSWCRLWTVTSGEDDASTCASCLSSSFAFCLCFLLKYPLLASSFSSFPMFLSTPGPERNCFDCCRPTSCSLLFGLFFFSSPQVWETDPPLQTETLVRYRWPTSLGLCWSARSDPLLASGSRLLRKSPRSDSAGSLANKKSFSWFLSGTSHLAFPPWMLSSPKAATNRL